MKLPLLLQLLWRMLLSGDFIALPFYFLVDEATFHWCRMNAWVSVYVHICLDVCRYERVVAVVPHAMQWNLASQPASQLTYSMPLAGVTIYFCFISQVSGVRKWMCGSLYYNYFLVLVFVWMCCVCLLWLKRNLDSILWYALHSTSQTFFFLYFFVLFHLVQFLCYVLTELVRL